MFGKKLDVTHMVFALGLVMVASYFGNKFRQTFTEGEQRDEYELVKKYLLNDSALYGKNRPKIWIHSKYELNARKWKNFMSRNTNDLNQPYLYLTIQSIINHCGDDFHVCLIDDESFEKLIPSWTMDLSTVPEPMRSRYRDIAMLQLLYIYGGMIVPNSFLCVKPMIEIYNEKVVNKCPFMAEKKMYLANVPQSKPFLPDMHFMGAPKEDPMIQRMITEMNVLEGSNHFQSENEFCEKMAQWCWTHVQDQAIQLIDGECIGVKTRIGKPILLEDLMSDDYLDVESCNLYGINIPSCELLRRPKFQYFSILPVEEIMKTDTILTKYFKSSMVDGTNEYYKKRSTLTSMVAI